MRKSSKWLTGLCAAGALLSLSACGSDDKKSSEDNSNKSKTLTVSVEQDNYAKFVNNVKGKFEKDNGVKVKVVKKPMTDQCDAIQLDGPSGKGPDVFIAPNDRVGSMGKQGQLLEVNDKTMPKDFSKEERQLVTINKKKYGVPLTIESLVLFYNKKYLDEAPKTFKELETLAKDPKFAFDGESGKNTAFLAKWTDFFYGAGLIQGYGGYIFGDNGTNPNKLGLATPDSVKAVDYAWDWYNNVWPKGMKDVKGAGDFVTDCFTSGKSAAIIDGPWMAETYKKAKVDYGVSTIPTLPNGKPYKPFAGGKSWVGSAYTKNKEMTEKLLTYLGSKENETKFYKMTSEVPANPVSRKEVPSSDELAKAVIEQFKVAKPAPNIPEMSEVWTGAENMMYDAVSGPKDKVKSVLEKANKNIESSIKEKYEDK